MYILYFFVKCNPVYSFWCCCEWNYFLHFIVDVHEDIEIIDFCILLFYPETLPNSCILIVFSGFFMIFYIQDQSIGQEREF